MTRPVIVFFIVFASLVLVLPPILPAMSIDEESKLGEKFLERAFQEFEVMENYYVSRFLNDLATLLYNSENNKPFAVKIYCVRRNELNAFAGPAGHIFVFSGLVDKLPSIDHLAAVISHEMAHVTARHLSQRISSMKKIGLATLAGMLLGGLIGGAPGEAIMAGTIAVGAERQLAYSREDERQADQLGARYMLEGGFMPQAALELHKILQKETLFQSSQVPAYLLTHPTSAERMANLDSIIKTMGTPNSNQKEKELRDQFPFVQTLIRALSMSTTEAVKYFNEPAVGQDILRHFGLGVAYVEARDLNKAFEYLEMALRLSPNNTILNSYAGRVLLEMGEPDRALSYLKRVMEKDAQDMEVGYLMAEALWDMGKEDDALVYYQRGLHTSSPKPELYYKIGNIYGKRGKLDLAHYNLGLYFLKTKDRKKASFHFQKALELTQDPELRVKIKEYQKDLGTTSQSQPGQVKTGR